MESSIKNIETPKELAEIIVELVKQGVQFVASKSNGNYTIEITGGY